MTTVYVAVFVVGAISILVALLATDFEFGGHHGAGEGLPFLSLTSLSAGLVGAGTGGLVSTWTGLGSVGAAVIAALSGIALVLAFQAVLLPYLRRQQANSHTGRASYVGLLGTVTLDVPTDGWGEVAFVDTEGNRVRARAVTAEPSALPKSTPIYIADVDAEFVHVVTVPGPPAIER